MKTQPRMSRPHKYLLLAQYFRDQIHSGVLKPGDRMPSFAQMMAEHRVGQGTLERTYSLLEEEQIIVREANRGTFVAETKNRESLGVVGVLSSREVRRLPYYTYLMEGIQDVACEHRIEVLLMPDEGTINWEKMDGVIFTGAPLRTPPTMPAVNLVRYADEITSIMTDDYAGARAAMEHLLSLGHRRIAFLLLGGHHPTELILQQRLKAYYDVLKEAGIEAQPQWVRPLRDPWEHQRPFFDLGYDRINEWLREDWSALGCTAILAHNDVSARGVIRAFREAGLDVPDDVSVVGFDGTEVAEYTHPSLTTVAVPLREIGAAGMRFILREIESPQRSFRAKSEVRQEILPARLIVLDTTAAAPDVGSLR